MSINNTLKKENIKDYLNIIIEKNKQYGKNNTGQNKKINITYINTNQQPIINNHNLYNIIYSDNLSRLMSYCGYEVTKEYYQRSPTVNSNLSEDFKTLKKELDTYRIYYDKFTSLNTPSNEYILEEVINKLQHSNYCYIKDNNLILNTTNNNNQKDEIIIDSTGNYSDLIYDITYHYTNLNHYNYQIDILEPNNSFNPQNIKSSLKILNIKDNYLDTKIQNKVIENNYNNINELRYYIATNLQSNNYTYIENTYLKINNILNNNRKSLKKINNYNNLNNDIAYTILNKICQFEDIIINTVNNTDTNILTNYISELTILSEKLINKENINFPNNIYTNELLNLLQAIKIIINNSLNLIGIIPKEEI